MRMITIAVAALAAATLTAQAASANGVRNPAYDALVAKHAKANDVPESLVHRVIVRESRYNPRAVSKGNYGMMQIRYGTAQGMGYRGPVSGLLDADTNMTYAVRYLGNAYRVAGGNHDQAVRLYAGGYYYVAKRKGMLASLRGPNSTKPSVGKIEMANVATAPSASAAATASPKVDLFASAADLYDRAAR